MHLVIVSEDSGALNSSLTRILNSVKDYFNNKYCVHEICIQPEIIKVR